MEYASAESRTRTRRIFLARRTQDMKIASIALAHDVPLLTRNTVDFAKVPGLRCENWLDRRGGE